MFVEVETVFSSQFHISSMEYQSCTFKFVWLELGILMIIRSYIWENDIQEMLTPGTWCDNIIIQVVANAHNCVQSTLS